MIRVWLEVLRPQAFRFRQIRVKKFTIIIFGSIAYTDLNRGLKPSVHTSFCGLRIQVDEMPLLVIFIFGAVILGTGAMLSPAWPTPQPRIGLAGALALALIIGGAVFWSMLFGWDTLVVDYMLFALVVGIFLYGTFSHGQTRAEKRGEVLLDKDQGWPGPLDLVLFGLVAVVFVSMMIYLLPQPPAEVPGLGYAALSARLTEPLKIPAGFELGATFTTYPPGFSALIAYLHQQLGEAVHIIQRAIGAVAALLCVWLAYDFGAEIQDKRLGRAMAIALSCAGLVALFIDGWFTLIVALAFALALFIYAYRYLRYGYPVDAIGAGLMLGAILITHTAALMGVLAGYIMWMGTIWLGREKLTIKRWLGFTAIVPLVAALATAPWWVWRLSQTTFNAPTFEPLNLFTLPVLLALLLPVVLAAVIGASFAGQRHHAAILALGWLAAVIVYSILMPGNLAALYTGIIPLSILSGMGMMSVWDRVMHRETTTISTTR